MDIAVGRTEAESLDLSGYDVERRGDASGGSAIKTLGTGSATGTFQGPSGLYALTVNYFDESDGAATFELRVNGAVVESWTGTGGTSAFGTVTPHEIQVALSSGDTISLHGSKGGEELARFDSIDLQQIAGSSIDIGVGLTEAEALDIEGGYEVQANAAAANGTVVGTLTEGAVSGVFSGAAGDYDLTVNYLDESDGDGIYRLLVNGEEVRSWIGDGGRSPSGTAETETVTLTLQPGDEIRVEGTRTDGEAARLDSLLIEESGGPLPPPPPPPPPPPAPPPPPPPTNGDLADLGVGTTEAEALSLEGGYEIETRSDASGGQAIRTLADSGTASGVFTGGNGTYDLAIDHFNESDGVATWVVLVNGSEEARFSGFGGQGGFGTLATETVTLELATGDVVAVQGLKGGGELARLDALTLTPAGTDPGPDPDPGEPGGATLSVGITEAESLALAGDYEIETGRSDASGGQLIRVLDGQSGSASGTFAGADGSYDVSVGYFDESDGVASFQLVVNGEVVEAWQGTGGLNGLGSRAERSVTVDLEDGDTIELRGTKGNGELARFDAVSITPADPGTGDPGTGDPGPVDGTIAVGLTEAESLDLSGGYEIQNNPGAANGQVVGTLTTGSASGSFTGTDGAYDLTVNYLDESDGVSTWTLKVDGAVIDSWQGTGGGSVSGTLATRTISVDLDQGDVISIEGIRNEGEAARIDSLLVAPASSDTGNGDPGSGDPGGGDPGGDPGGGDPGTGGPNVGPQVAAPVPNLFFTLGEASSYTLPSGRFTDANGDALTLSAKLSGPGTKGNWLSFDAATGTFSGTPVSTTNGPLVVDVTASDGSQSVTDRFIVSTVAEDIDSADLGVGRTEAEDLSLTNFSTERRGDASDGESIVNDSGWKLAYMGGEFDGPAGNYDLTLGFFNESGGNENFAIEVNGISTDFISTGSGGSSRGQADDITINVDLEPGDEIVVVSRNNGSAEARIDFVDLVATGATSSVFAVTRADPVADAFDFAALEGAPLLSPAAVLPDSDYGDPVAEVLPPMAAETDFLLEDGWLDGDVWSMDADTQIA